MPYCRRWPLEHVGMIQPNEPVPPEMDAKLDMTVAGVNHCTWILRCFYDGKDMMPGLKEYLDRAARQEYEERPSSKAKPRLNNNYCKVLTDLFDAFPTAISHTKEYVPYFQGKGVMPETPEPLIDFDGYNRQEEMDAAWEKTEKLANGETPIEDFFKEGRGDHATDIIESMWGNLGKKFYINCANRGAVPNLPDDAFLELLCELDMEHGPQPLPACDMPRGLLSLTYRILDTHELTAKAAVECDRHVLMQALACDPLTTNLEDIRMIIDELLVEERDHLPTEWFK
jgi:alpha-galactosidase